MVVMPLQEVRVTAGYDKFNVMLDLKAYMVGERHDELKELLSCHSGDLEVVLRRRAAPECACFAESMTQVMNFGQPKDVPQQEIEAW